MKNEYWVMCEEYTYFRMKVGANSPEEARAKAFAAIKDGSYEKYKDENGEGGVEITGFCDEDGCEVSYYCEDRDFWNHDNEDDE